MGDRCDCGDRFHPSSGALPRCQARVALWTHSYHSLNIGAGLPPLITHGGDVDSAKSLAVQIIDILVLSLLMYHLARWALHRFEFRLYPLTTVPALAWLVASALSALNARELDVTAIQFGEMVKLFLLYIVVANGIENDADIKWLAYALLVGVLFQGLLGSYQGITGHPLGLSFLTEPSPLFYGRASGTMAQPNGYGMFVAATPPRARSPCYSWKTRTCTKRSSLRCLAPAYWDFCSAFRGVAGWALGWLQLRFWYLLFAGDAATYSLRLRVQAQFSWSFSRSFLASGN